MFTLILFFKFYFYAFQIQHAGKPSSSALTGYALRYDGSATTTMIVGMIPMKKIVVRVFSLLFLGINQKGL